MIKIRYIISVIVSLFVFASCQTTDDPRSGGLFSYNPESYERRIQERQQRLTELENQQALEQQTSEQLEKELAQKQADKDALSKKMAALEQEIAKLKNEIQNINAQTEKQEHELLRIEAETKALEEELEEIKSKPAEEAEPNKKEIERLERTIDELLKEAEALSRM